MTKPMTCAKGAIATMVSRGPSFSVARACPTAATRLAWVSMTPLGRPVVPLEYGSSATVRAGSSATAGAGPSALDRPERHDLAHAGRRGDLARRGQARGNGGEDRGLAVHRLGGELALGGHRAGAADRGPGRHGAEGRDGPLGRVGRPEDERRRPDPARAPRGRPPRARCARGERRVGDGGAATGRRPARRDRPSPRPSPGSTHGAWRRPCRSARTCSSTPFAPPPGLAFDTCTIPRGFTRVKQGDRAQRNARAHILDTAWRLVGERGVQAVTVADIAAASGVSRQLVYHHFESRAGLLVAMTRHHDAASGFRKRLVATRDLEPVEGFEAGLTTVAGLRARGPPRGPRARGRAHRRRRGRRGLARPHGRHPRGLPPRRRARPGAGRTSRRGRLGLRAPTSPRGSSLVADRGWPAGDYVERTVASIMAEVVAPARDE